MSVVTTEASNHIPQGNGVPGGSALVFCVSTPRMEVQCSMMIREVVNS
jgi:hypothetical protein